MAYRGGFGGFGGGNQMQNLMKQAQKMQEEMQRAQEELDEMEIDFSDTDENTTNSTTENANEIILELKKSGMSIIEIAKQLGLGVGEVKLVVDLYQGV